MQPIFQQVQPGQQHVGLNNGNGFSQIPPAVGLQKVFSNTGMPEQSSFSNAALTLRENSFTPAVNNVQLPSQFAHSQQAPVGQFGSGPFVGINPSNIDVQNSASFWNGQQQASQQYQADGKSLVNQQALAQRDTFNATPLLLASSSSQVGKTSRSGSPLAQSAPVIKVAPRAPGSMMSLASFSGMGNIAYASSFASASVMGSNDRGPDEKAVITSPHGVEPQWNTSLFDFCAAGPDGKLGFGQYLSCFVPCLAAGKVYSSVGGSSDAGCLTYTAYCPCLLAPIISAHARTQYRAQFDIDGSVCDDYASHIFCHPCALAQEVRELQFRSSMAPSKGQTKLEDDSMVWSTSIFACGQEGQSRVCALSTFLHPFRFAQTWRNAENSAVCSCISMSLAWVCCSQWILGCWSRGMLRQNYQIEGSCCDDCLVWFFCPWCAARQEAAHLDDYPWNGQKVEAKAKVSEQEVIGEDGKKRPRMPGEVQLPSIPCSTSVHVLQIKSLAVMLRITVRCIFNGGMTGSTAAQVRANVQTGLQSALLAVMAKDAPLLSQFAGLASEKVLPAMRHIVRLYTQAKRHSQTLDYKQSQVLLARFKKNMAAKSIFNAVFLALAAGQPWFRPLASQVLTLLRAIAEDNSHVQQELKLSEMEVQSLRNLDLFVVEYVGGQRPQRVAHISSDPFIRKVYSVNNFGLGKRPTDSGNRIVLALDCDFMSPMTPSTGERQLSVLGLGTSQAKGKFAGFATQSAALVHVQGGNSQPTAVVGTAINSSAPTQTSSAMNFASTSVSVNVKGEQSVHTAANSRVDSSQVSVAGEQPGTQKPAMSAQDFLNSVRGGSGIASHPGFTQYAGNRVYA